MQTTQKGLTDEQKAEFRKKGEEYQKLKYDINEQIVQLEIQKNKLERQLRDAMSRTPNGRLVCKTCHVRSMKYVGRTPKGGMSGGEEIYECEICGHEETGYSLF
jgi:hypothetical protein